VKIALDTNILAYAEGVNTAEKKQAALEVVRRLAPEAVVIPVQALGELFYVLVRKAGKSPSRARTAILSWQDAFEVVETSSTVLLSAIDLAGTHRLSIWDAIMVSAAADAGCRLLLTEDMQDGFTWKGVTVANPFAASLNPLLQSALSE
jgi:predicted nucleic acid-binding protein